jgi:hypothetical protein
MRSKCTKVVVTLVAVFALGAVASSAALAATPEWKFEGKTIKTALKVTGWWEGSGKLELSDSALNTELSCTVRSENSISAKTLETTNTEWLSCTFVKQGLCESTSHYEPTDEALGLPWTSELYEEGGKLRERIKGSKGAAVGWAFTCGENGTVVGQECTASELTAALSNVTGGVDAAFESLTPKLKCKGHGNPEGSGSLEGAEFLEDTGLTAVL